MATKGTVARTTSNTIEVRNVEFETWIDQMQLQAETLDADDEFDPRNIMTAANSASTFEEVAQILSGTGIKNGKDLVGITHVIHSYKLRKSDVKYAEQGMKLGVYAVVTATIDGEDMVYATGAPNIICLLWQAEKFERLPLKAVITSRETANGDLLNLKPLFS